MDAKLPIALNVVLPDVGDGRDACVHRLEELLEAKSGVSKAHRLMECDGDSPERLCVHFDRHELSVSDVCNDARRAGLELHEHYGHLVTDTKPMHVRKARHLSSELLRENGVIEAHVSAAGSVRVEFERQVTDEARVRARLSELLGDSGHSVAAAPGEEHEKHRHGGPIGEWAEVTFAALSGALLLVGWLLPKVVAVPQGVAIGALVAAYVFGGAFPLKETFENLRRGRFEIDFLMVLAAAGAAVLGEWAEGALLLFLFSLGHGLESYAMRRAKNAIESLSQLAPDTALVLRGGRSEEVPVGDLIVGDIVVVKPNERLPADGFVTKGESAVNQAPITGESVPVDKQPVENVQHAREHPSAVDSACRVFAGTINGSGTLEVQVSQAATQSTLARVMKMVSEAETRRSPTQQLTERFERVFVPAVLGVAVLMLFGWVVVEESFAQSFYRAMAVLVAASPCALAIATPSAVLSGVARAARSGVLVKGGAPLESLGRIEAIAFDKTGTLTEGKPRLSDIAPMPGVSDVDLLRIAVGVEALSDHPLAAAVVREGRDRLGSTAPATATGLQSITGRGVRADVDGRQAFIGKDDLFDELPGPALPEELRGLVLDLEERGRTTMIVRHGDRYLGVLGLMDAPRKSAARVIKMLREIGVRRMVMISGDNQRVASAVAEEVGLDEARGDLMPDDKVEVIKALRSEGLVAMVGDGVNDAPAMANAMVGIAMGAAGSDVALETADVALMADSLDRLPFAVALSRAASRAIRQNLWMSLGVVALLVPATVMGLGIGPAVVVHEGSTVLVVLNALRLLGFKDVEVS